jgi:hypothetical protein
VSFLAVILCAACGSSGNNAVNSDDQARRAYLGLDKSISKSLALGFMGYNAATSANIPTETTAGDVSGALTVTGHVDQGNPNQVSMGLSIAMTMYSDGKIAFDDMGDSINLTYATSAAALPSLSLKLNASAGNTLTGSLSGDYTMSGDLEGKVTLNLQIDGKFSGTAPNVMRVAGSTKVTGTAVNSSGGTYTVNTTI